jgi:hypothetical protein
VREGRVRYREQVVEGLERAPEALAGLLRGENFGKLLVRVGPRPPGVIRKQAFAPVTEPRGTHGAGAAGPASG